MDPDPEPNPYKIITDLAPDPGGPKTYGAGSGTLVSRWYCTKAGEIN